MLIIGIEPRAPREHIYSQAYAPRVGLPRLLTTARDLGHDCLIYCEELDSSQVDWDMIAKADLVLISSTTSTAPRAYELVAMVRQVNQSAPILGGGPHFTFEYEEALKSGIDYVFRHWADVSFFEWLDWYQSLANPRKITASDLSLLESIRGLAFMVVGQVKRTGRPLEVNPDSWPTPDLRLVVGHKPKFIVLITSEGCDHNCSFCSEWTMHGARYRRRSPEKVIEDLHFYRQVHGRTPVFFGDDNLAADLKDDNGMVIEFGQERLARLCHMIINAGLITEYSGQVRLSLGENQELQALMSRTGFDRVYIGFESINPANAAATGGKLEFDRMEAQTRAFHDNGISVHAMWVLGFDADTLDTVRRTIQAAIRWKIDTNQFLCLMPLPGSKLRMRLLKEGRVIHNQWDLYDGHHAVLYPARMAPWQLQWAVMLEAMPRVYRRAQTWRLYFASNWRTLRRWFAHRAPHPGIEFKSHLITLILRLNGYNLVTRARARAEEYLETLKKVTTPKHG